jgi:hypothetical protein
MAQYQRVAGSRQPLHADPSSARSLPQAMRARRRYVVSGSTAEVTVESKMLYTVEFRHLDKRWIVRREGAGRITSTHPSQSAAEGAARARARRQRCDVVVMGADGVVERRYDHDNVPRNRSGVIRMPRGA